MAPQFSLLLPPRHLCGRKMRENHRSIANEAVIRRQAIRELLLFSKRYRFEQVFYSVFFKQKSGGASAGAPSSRMRPTSVIFLHFTRVLPPKHICEQTDVSRETSVCFHSQPRRFTVGRAPVTVSPRRGSRATTTVLPRRTAAAAPRIPHRLAVRPALATALPRRAFRTRNRTVSPRHRARAPTLATTPPRCGLSRCAAPHRRAPCRA